jgi:peptidoglycan/xylan/chitin deacetylase (PgdA/CDA1 family)
MRVALTIDTEQKSRPAGSGNFERQLAALEAAGVRVTCFVQGRWAGVHPDLARRIADGGHVVANHSYHHAPLSRMTDEGIRHTVERAEAAIVSSAGVPTTRPWFRCPYGDGEHDARVLGVLAGLGFRNVGWDVDACDWRPGRTVDEVVDAVVDGCRRRGDGARVLLHSWPDVTAAALPLIVKSLAIAGSVFVTVDDLP